MWTLCSHCEFSSWDGNTEQFSCSKSLIPSKRRTECDEYICCAVDKVNGIRSKESKCFICGKTIYSRGREMPAYCEKHRAYADKDSKCLETAPKELLFSLIAGIFLRAREDYIYNTDGRRKDAEIFLRSEWAQELSQCGFDVEKLMDLLDREKADELERTREDSER